MISIDRNKNIIVLNGEYDKLLTELGYIIIEIIGNANEHKPKRDVQADVLKAVMAGIYMPTPPKKNEVPQILTDIKDDTLEFMQVITNNSLEMNDTEDMFEYFKRKDDEEDESIDD